MKKYLFILLVLAFAQTGCKEKNYLIRTLPGYSVYSVSYSPDGKYIASGNEDASVNIWDIESGSLVRTLKGHTMAVLSVSYSPDGKYLASAGQDSTIKLWDAQTGTEVRTLVGHSESINTVSFFPDGKYLISGSDDTTMIIWAVSTGGKISTVKGRNKDDHIASISCSPDGKYIASGSWDKTITVRDALTHKEIKRLTGHNGSVEVVAYAPDSKYVASGSGDKSIKIWDVSTGMEIWTLKGHRDDVWSVAYSHDGKYLASGSGDKTIQFWDTSTGQRIGMIAAHENTVSSLSFSQDGNYIASGSADKTIKIWMMPFGEYRGQKTEALKALKEAPSKNIKEQAGPKAVVPQTAAPQAPVKPINIKHPFAYRIGIAICLFISLLVLIGYYVVKGSRQHKLVEKIEENLGDMDLVSKLFEKYIKGSAHDITVFKPETLCKIYKHKNMMDKAVELPLPYRESMFNHLIKDKDFAHAYTIFKSCHIKNFDPAAIFEMHEKLGKMKNLLIFVQSIPHDERSASDWKLLISAYDKLNKLGTLNPSDLPEEYIKKIVRLLEEKKDYYGLMGFIQSLPRSERSSADWELLILSYDMLNKLGALNPSDLPDEYRKKVLQLFEEKKDYYGLMGFIQSLPLNERLAPDWELLISAYDKLNKLGALNPSDLPDEYRKKVLQLFEEKKDYYGLIGFVQSIPRSERSTSDWEVLISAYDKLDKLGDLNQLDLPDEYRRKVLQLLEKRKEQTVLIPKEQAEKPQSRREAAVPSDNKPDKPDEYRKKIVQAYEEKKDYNGLLSFVQLIPRKERSADDWELLISLHDKLNKLGSLSPSDVPDNYRKKVVQLYEEKKDYAGLLSFVQLIPRQERSAADWELLISSYEMLDKLGGLKPSDLPDVYRQKVIQLFNKKKDYAGLLSFVQLIPRQERSAADWELLISSYEMLDKLGGLKPSDLPDVYRQKVIQLFNKKKDYAGLLSFVQLIPRQERSAADWELLISSYEMLDKLGELNPSDLPDNCREKVIELYGKKKDYDGLMNFIQSIPQIERSASDWEVLISAYDKLNKLADLNPSDLPDICLKNVIQLFEEKRDHAGLINFIQSIPRHERSASDWEVLISAYDKLDKLGALKPSDLPEEYRKKVIQLFEKKKDPAGLMSFFQLIPQNERSLAAWELLISSYSKLNRLGDLNPSDLPEDCREKVIQLFEEKKDDAGLMNFIQLIPRNKRSAADWELLISAYDKLNKLSDLNPSDLPADSRRKVISLFAEKKDHTGLMNFFQLIQRYERSAADWELLISAYDKLNKLGDLNASDLPDAYRQKVIQLFENKKDYAGLVSFIQLIPHNERSAADWEVLISSYDKLDKLVAINPLDLPDDFRRKVISLFQEKKDYAGLVIFIQLIPRNLRSQADWEVLILSYDKLNKLGTLDPLGLSDDSRRKVILLFEEKKDHTGLINFIQSIPQDKRSPSDWELLISAYDKLGKLGDIDQSGLPDEYRKKITQLLEQKKDHAGGAVSRPRDENSAADLEQLISSYDKLNKLGDLNPADLPDEYSKKVIRLLEEKKDQAGLTAYLSRMPEEMWTIETYQSWFESCLKNGVPDSAVKPLSSIQNRSDAESIYEFYYQKALQFEREGFKDNAILIYSKFVHEHIFFKDIPERYVKLSEAPAAIQPEQSKSTPDEKAVAPLNQEKAFNPNYRTLREIGRGSMGVVYDAIDKKRKKQVAIKKMKEELAANPLEKKRFMEETSRVMELHHANIVDIYDMYEEGSDIYLVFEYVSGDTVDGLLNKHEQLKLKETLDIILPVCSALEFAHGQKIIHGDIKPSNIMVTKGKLVKVTDFGIALQAKEILTRVTGKDAYGTHAYMPPEQVPGVSSVQSDIYSLGITMYEMLSGDVPFKGTDLMVQKRTMLYRPLREVDPKIPRNIDEIINNCLQVNKEKRYHLISELVTDIRKNIF
ncbi:MAG: protein kinase [Elusimicrobia bacterium]|nr:protein kinase [Candidatus Liberimonas magnetica]